MLNPGSNIGYLKNRLRANLQAGTTYCVKFYVNISNNSPRGMDGFGAYFGDSSIDTITKCNVPLTYLHPQVQNPAGNVITDTLNWVPITGTFTANGTEKYMLIGNFLPDNAVTTASINTPYYPQVWTDLLVEDASCIAIDLPAYAGPDQPVIAGGSVYIGREADFAMDEACTWYLWPDMTTPIANAAGLWVSPVVTSTYVVKQEVYCGSTRWDTVVVYMDAVGLKEVHNESLDLEIFPNPAKDQVSIVSPTPDETFYISIRDIAGRTITAQSIKTSGRLANLALSLVNGAYVITITNDHHQSITKKLLIAQ